VADIVVLQPRRRSRRSFSAPVLIEDAPPLGEELDANRVSYAGWVCVLIIFGMAAVLWAALILGSIFVLARPH
jgi:hypothetical protein